MNATREKLLRIAIANCDAALGRIPSNNKADYSMEIAAADWITIREALASPAHGQEGDARAVIGALLSYLQEVASAHNDRSCEYDVCKEVRDAHAMLASAPAPGAAVPVAPCWLIVAHGESDYPDAITCYTREQVRSAFVQLAVGVDDAMHAEEIDGYMESFDDPDEWGEGMQYHAFEIGGIYAFNLFDGLAPPPADLSSHWLGELLAVIHGDGGHYQSEHGTAKASQDAMVKLNDLQRAADLSGVRELVADVRTHLAGRALSGNRRADEKKMLGDLCAALESAISRVGGAKEYRLCKCDLGGLTTAKQLLGVYPFCPYCGGRIVTEGGKS